MEDAIVNILVIGGAGYIGSHTCKALAQSGYSPVSFDNLSYGHEWSVQWGPFVKGNILNRVELSDAFRQYKPEAVLNFAAFAYVGESVSDPGKYYTNNVSGALSILETMREYGCRFMINSSTCAIYGLPETVPIPENHAQNPINPYGRSKLMIERILTDYDSAYNLKSVSLRYFNAAGADPDGDLGEEHSPETHLIPLAVKAALGQKEFLEIFGTDYETPDGTAIRDYIHVSDLAEAHVRALDYLFEGGDTDFINIGTRKGHSVKEVIEAVEKVSGRTVPARESGRRPGDPPVLVANSRKAFDVLKWSPEYLDLEDTVKTAWEWHSRHCHKFA
ncbi:MAG: UDP-glucose 4-epimerase GalE [Gemmatimonadota bacterium]|nr:UDP-glucose 4-epimerase GalE [Gemmatimonadota bacterium]